MINRKIVTAISLTSLGIVLSGTSVFANNKTGTVIASTLNIRSGPSTNNNIIGYVHHGDKLQILGTSNGWYKVKLSNGKIGWGSGNYINLNEEESSENIISSEDRSSGKTGIITADALNIRNGASISFDKVSVAYKGQSVEILEFSNGWYKIKTQNGQVGWVSSNYVNTSINDKLEETDKTEQTEIRIREVGTITANTLNIRNGSSTGDSILGKLYKGQSVEILGISNGWYKIKTQNGQVGWASSSYISTNESKVENSENNSTTNKQTYNNTQSIVNIAKAQLGKPYVWGSEGPNSFDCSGLVYYVYGQNGVNMPRTSREQANIGKTVSQSQLQPGDLIFSSTDGSGNVNHVGIYIGNGQMIHAPKVGDVVKTTSIGLSYWQNTYVTAKRVL